MTGSALRAVGLGLIVVVCASCASQPVQERVTIAMPNGDAQVEPNGDSYIVFGVKPETVRLSIAQGTVKDGTFSLDTAKALPVYGPAGDGFIVFKAKPGTTLAIVDAQVLSKATDTAGPQFHPCEHTIVFTVPTGKVLYVASVDFGISPDASYGPRGQIVPSYYTQKSAALAFLMQHYPDLAPDLEEGKPEFLKIDNHC